MANSKFKEAVPLILFVVIGLVIILATTLNMGLDQAKAGTTTDTQVKVGNATPTLTVSLNNGNNITLNEGTWTSVTTTVTVTDPNGCDTITGVTTTLWWAPLNAASSTACTYDGETCYPIEADIDAQVCTATTSGDTANTCDGGTDTTVEYDCAFHIWYIATSTDNVANYIWSVAATSTDTSEARGTASNTQETIEINTTSSLDVTNSINYSSVSAGNDTGGTNQETTVTATGNFPIDTQIYSTDIASNYEDYMCIGYPTCDTETDRFGVWMEQYKLSTFTYGDAAALCLTSTDTPTSELEIEKPKATTTPDQTDIVYWGIGIPTAQKGGTYSGQNTFAAQADYTP